MFDIGFWELLILFGLGLLVLGPEKLPRVAIQLGNWAGQARRMARTLTTQVRQELDIDLNKPFGPGYSTAHRTQPAYKRPGVDDLKPGAANQAGGDATASDPEPETQAQPTTSDPSP